MADLERRKERRAEHQMEEGLWDMRDQNQNQETAARDAARAARSGDGRASRRRSAGRSPLAAGAGGLRPGRRPPRARGCRGGAGRRCGQDGGDQARLCDHGKGTHVRRGEASTSLPAKPPSVRRTWQEYGALQAVGAPATVLDVLRFNPMGDERPDMDARHHEYVARRHEEGSNAWNPLVESLRRARASAGNGPVSSAFFGKSVARPAKERSAKEKVSFAENLARGLARGDFAKSAHALHLQDVGARAGAALAKHAFNLGALAPALRGAAKRLGGAVMSYAKRNPLQAATTAIGAGLGAGPWRARGRWRSGALLAPPVAGSRATCSGAGFRASRAAFRPVRRSPRDRKHGRLGRSTGVGALAGT